MHSWIQCHPQRFEAEVRLMRQLTGATIAIHRGEIYWCEDIKVRDSSPSYRLLIAYPPGFPGRAPDCYVIRPVLGRNTPHMSVNGTLDLFADPFHRDARATAVAARNRAIAWLRGYERWRKSGAWG